MKYFVLASNELSILQQNAITDYFKQRQHEYGFWHWFPNFWLLTSGKFDDSVQELRNAIVEAAPQAQFMLFAVEPVAWAGRGDPKWAEWLQENWRRR